MGLIFDLIFAEVIGKVATAIHREVGTGGCAAMLGIIVTVVGALVWFIWF